VIHRIKEEALSRLSILYNIITKNLKLLIRTRSSALIIILGPIIITLLVSMAFSTSGLYDIRIGAYSKEYNDNINSILVKLADKEFTVTKMASEDICIDSVKSGKTHICLILPENLDMTEDIQREIVFHVDYSRINLVWTILDVVSSRISEQSSEWSFNLTVDILGRLDSARQRLADERNAITIALNSSTSTAELASEATLRLSGLNMSFALESFNYYALKDSIEDVSRQLNESSSNDSIDIVGLEYEFAKMEKKLNATSQEAEIVNDGIKAAMSRLLAISQSSKDGKQSIEAVESAINEVDESIQSLNVKNATTIVNPLLTTIKPISTGKTNLDYVVSLLIVMVTMLIAVLLASATVMAEKTSRAYFRRYIASTPSYIYVFATYLTVMLILIFQLAIFIIISHFFLKTQFTANFFVLALVLFIIASFFTLAGMAVGYLFNSEETSAIAAISFSSVSIFFSNTILPLENMPSSIRVIAMLNPFVLSHSVLNKAFLFQASLAKLVPDIYYIGVYIAGLALLIVALQAVNRIRLSK